MAAVAGGGGNGSNSVAGEGALGVTTETSKESDGVKMRRGGCNSWAFPCPEPRAGAGQP